MSSGTRIEPNMSSLGGAALPLSVSPTTTWQARNAAQLFNYDSRGQEVRLSASTCFKHIGLEFGSPVQGRSAILPVSVNYKYPTVSSVVCILSITWAKGI